ncbi:hypothetical protein [Rhodococcus coprophilus]|uniref:Uncharacterized protein n=1 Tax=Rhodococcus coprophilus TaxID=38310 RepID=A0A2X4U165_9NOCA|nr:hypothetical protein [Rhodococcus coprophilus]MBM7458578.1 hypothetical protein [Rhodococcus coprophilus]SQI32923.1 Uncharacterised protein [Rhodococcus coprophilus]
MDALIDAAVRAAEHGAPARTWKVSPEAAVHLGSHHGHPYEGLTVTHWTD